MAELTGTPQYVVNTAHGNSSQALTIPADCTAVLVFSWAYVASTAVDFTALNWDGGGLDFTQVVTNKSTSDPYDVWAYIMTSADGNWPGTGSQTLNWTFNGTPGEGGTVVIAFLKDVNTASPVVDTDSQKTGATWTASLSGVGSSDLTFIVVVDYQNTGAPSSTGSGQSVLTSDTGNDNGVNWVIAYEAGEAGPSASGGTLAEQGTFTGFIAFSIADGVPAATLEQEGFAFGDDDGSESGHTLNTQDSNATAEVAAVKTLRLLIDATSDPAATAYALRYQKNGAGGYTAVPTSSGGKTQPVIDAGDCTESGDNATTPSSPWSVSRPTAVSGDLLILVIGWDDSTNNTGITVANGPNGEVWSQINSVVASASTEVRMTAYYVVATGSWGAGSISVTPAANEQWTATAIHVPAGEFDAATPIGASATRASAGTAETNALSPVMTAGASDGSGTLIFAVTTDTDPLTTLQSGFTSIANTDRGNEALGVAVRDTAVSNSESIAGGDTWALASDSWCSIAFVVRAPTVTNEIYITASANVAAGGEATTARLTPPSGKTTGDFATGRRWDDENGADSIDIGADEYTELEWVLTTQSPAAVDDYYDFRVYAGAAALDTYTVTPRLTLISGSSPVTEAAGPGQAQAAGQKAAVFPGAVTLPAKDGQAQAAGLVASVTAGAVTIAAQAGQAAVVGNPAAVVVGATAVDAGVGQTAVAGQIATTSAGAAQVDAQAGQAAAAGNEAAVSSGAVAVGAGAGQVAAVGNTGTAVPGAVAVEAQAGAASVAGQVAVAGSAVAIAAGVGQTAVSGQSGAILPGAVAIDANPGQAAAVGQPAAVLSGVVVAAGVGVVSVAGMYAAVSTGAVSVASAVGAATVAGQTADVLTVTAVAAGVGQLVVAGQLADLVPGAVSVVAGYGAAAMMGAAGVVISGDIAALLLALRPRTFDLVLSERDFDPALRPRSFDLRLEDW